LEIGALSRFKSLVIQFPNTNQDAHNFLQQMTDGNYKVDGITYPQFTDQVLEVCFWGIVWVATCLEVKFFSSNSILGAHVSDFCH
jgi:hypothetical protein